MRIVEGLQALNTSLATKWSPGTCLKSNVNVRTSMLGTAWDDGRGMPPDFISGSICRRNIGCSVPRFLARIVVPVLVILLFSEKSLLSLIYSVKRTILDNCGSPLPHLSKILLFIKTYSKLSKDFSDVLLFIWFLSYSCSSLVCFVFSLSAITSAPLNFGTCICFFFLPGFRPGF